jgi:hypothetical protein
MHLVVLTVPEHRFRRAVRNAGTDLVAGDEALLLAMPGEEVQELVCRLVGDMLAAELAWLDEMELAYRLLLTDSGRSFIFSFASEDDADRFQAFWGGDMIGEDGDDGREELPDTTRERTRRPPPLLN